MKSFYLALTLLLGCALPALSQNVRVDGVIQSAHGPAPNVFVAVCSQPAVTTSTPCTTRIPLCSSLTDVVCTSPNPVTSDGLGNYFFYLPPGTYTYQFYGTGLQTRFFQDQQPGLAASVGGAVVLAPVGDQTILGSHQLINLGSGITGSPLAGFDANVQSLLVSSSFVALTGASLNHSPFNVGFQGVAQGTQAFGGFTVASKDSTSDDGETPYGIQSIGILSSTTNHSGTAYGVGGVGIVFPSPGTTTANAVGVSGGAELRTNGIVTRLVGVEGFPAINPGGGTITNNYGFDADLQSVGARNAAFHSVDQGAGANNYGILLDGVTHNNLGKGQTQANAMGFVDASLYSGTHWTDKVVTAYGSSQCSSGCTIIVPDSIADDGHATTPSIPSNVTLWFPGSASFTACTITLGTFTKVINHDSLLVESGSGCLGWSYSGTGPTLQDFDHPSLKNVRVNCNSQTNSIGISIHTTNGALYNIDGGEIIGCTTVGMYLEGVQFSNFRHVHISQSYVNLKLYVLNNSEGGSSNTFDTLEASSPSSGVSVILYNASTAQIITGNTFLTASMQASSIAALATIGDPASCGAICLVTTLIGGSPELNGGGAASVTIDGNVITKAGALFSSRAKTTWYNADIEDATATPEFLLNNSSVLSLYNPDGYGNGAGTIISTDATSTGQVFGENQINTGTLCGGSGKCGMLGTNLGNFVFQAPAVNVTGLTASLPVCTDGSKNLTSSTTGCSVIYYVSNSGSDGAAGTSPATAWQTIAKVNGFASFGPCDKVLFQRGGVWREQLVIPVSGAINCPFTVDAYGSGAAPQILGSISGNTAGQWTNESGSIWYISSPATPNIVWRDGVRLTLVAGKGSLANVNQFWYDTVNFRVYTFAAANPTIGPHTFEIAQRSGGITATDKNWITVQNLQVAYSNTRLIDCEISSGNCSHWTTSNNTINGAWDIAIGCNFATVSTPGSCDWYDADNNIISDFGGNAASDERGIQVLYGDSVHLWNNNITVSDLAGNGYGGGIRYSGKSTAGTSCTATALPIGNPASLLDPCPFMRGNTVTGTLATAHSTPYMSEKVSYLDVAYNYANGNFQNGLFWTDEIGFQTGDGDDHATVHNNIGIANGANTAGAMILNENAPSNKYYNNILDARLAPNINKVLWTRSATGGNSNDTKMLNNTVITPSGAVGISCGSSGGADTVSTLRCTIENNIIYATGTGAGLIAFDNAAHSSASNGHVVNYNLYFGPSLAYADDWYTTFYATPAAFHTAQGFETNAVNGDPLFVAPASGNYRLSANSPAISAALTLANPFNIGFSQFYSSAPPFTVDDQNKNVSGWNQGAIIFSNTTAAGAASPIHGICKGTATANNANGVAVTNMGGDPTVNTCLGSTGVSKWGTVVTHTCTLRNFYVNAGTAGKDATDAVMTLQDNAVPLAITCTVGAVTSCNDTTHTVTAGPGDMIWVKGATEAGTTLADVSVSVDCQ